MKNKFYFIFLFGLISTVFTQLESLALSKTGGESIRFDNPINKLSSQANELIAATSDLTLTIKNINTSVRSAATVKLYNADNSSLLSTLVTDISGQVVFSGLADGTYNYEVSYKSATISPLTNNTEYWGSGQATISGNSQSVVFTRNQPYISNDATFSPATIISGGQTAGSFTVKNTLPSPTDSYLSVWVDRDKVSSWDYNQITSPQTVNSGSTAVFPITFAPIISGTYYYYAFVYSKVNGIYVITDQYSWTQAFMVENQDISQIQWSGYTWNVKSGTGLGPGPNNWLANSSSVWVDGENNLHLKTQKIGTKWYCVEITSTQPFDYGEFTFQLSTNVEKFDKNVVLGLFTYENDTDEIDIEFSRWGNISNQIGGYVVQPTSAISHKNFPLNLTDNYSTHKFQWSPSEIYFQSYYGNFQNLPDQQHLITDWTYTGSQIPRAGKELLNLNLWFYKGLVPSDLKETEVIIKSFTFRKIGNLVVHQNEDNTSILRVCPNPTNGIFRIQGMPSNQKSSIEVYTTDGKLIMKRVSNSSTCEIDISNQISGTYLVVINKQRIRIVKE
jgi:hypothetical protein